MITGVSGGEVNITVATKDGKMSASTTVKVLIPAEDFELEDIVLTTIDKDIEPELVLRPRGLWLTLLSMFPQMRQFLL